MKKSAFVSSWSGGKDSCLAFYYAMQKDMQPEYLLTMIMDKPIFSLKKRIMLQQAQAINMPIIITKTTQETYENDYIEQLKNIVGEVDSCVFGDIDLEASLNWNKKLCQAVSLQPYLPLWQKDRYALVHDFLKLGFKATIVSINNDFLDKKFLGKELNLNLIEEFTQIGIDICGENGEYHTIVTDGPIFAKPLVWHNKGHTQYAQYSYLDLEL